MAAKFILHKDGSATIRTPFNQDWVDGLKLIIPWQERELTKDKEWLIFKNAIRLLDLFEDCFPYGEFEEER